MTEPERIQYLIDRLCGGSAINFATSIGIDKFRLSRIVHGKSRITKLVNIILETYPDINAEWLKTGEGYPGDLSIADVKAKYEKIIAEKDDMIRTLRRVIEECLAEKLPKLPKEQKGCLKGTTE